MINYFAIVVGLIATQYLLSSLKIGIQKSSFFFTYLTIINSIFIFLEGYSPYIFLAAGALAALARLLFYTENKNPVFNPSVFAVLIAISLFPQFGSITSWGENWKVTIYIFVLGSITSFFAKSLVLSWTYQLSFLILSLAATYFSTGIEFRETVPLFFFPATLLAIPSLIFTFHVITDPQTRPKTVKGQIGFAVALAAIDITLRRQEVVFADFWAYFFLQAFVATVSNLEFSKKFTTAFAR